MRRWVFALTFIVSLVAAPLVSAASTGIDYDYTNNRADDCIYFAETGHNLCGVFREWWVGWGDLATYGYPIGEAYVDQNTGLLTQWLQRARLEFHPGADPAHFDVLLGLLGNTVAASVPGRQPFQAASGRAGAGCTYFTATHHNLCGGFYSYWKRFGGLATFGYPISEEFTENGLTVQYFERQRFEWHPGGWPARYDVMLGLLGSQIHGVEPPIASTQPATPKGNHPPGWGMTCRFYTNQAQAQADYDFDPRAFAGLDPNYNGIACEELPARLHANNQAEAVAIAKQDGFPYCDTKGYQQSAQLSALICNNGGNTYVRLYFFHLGTLLPVRTGGSNISYLRGAGGDTIALNYPIWRNGAPHCCPTGNATVRFKWDGSTVVPLDTVPNQYP